MRFTASAMNAVVRPSSTSPLISALVAPSCSADRRAKYHKVPIDGLDGFEIPYANKATVAIHVEQTVAGTYAYTAEVENAGGLWTVGTLSPATSQEGSSGFEDVQFDLSLSATNSAANEKRFLVFRAKRTDTDQVGQFTSFLRIPIRGFAP